MGNRVVKLGFEERDGKLVVRSDSRLTGGDAERARALVARMFRFHDDLAPFYAKIAGDEMLGWASGGAGRILASPTVFEDVIKTICTTNCAWSATVRMTTALVELGGGALLWGQIRNLASIASDVVGAKLDLELLTDPARHSDEEAEDVLLALPGIGPYGAAHVMQLLGRHRLLVLDSWTRPTYLRLTGKKRAADSTIRRAFARYGARILAFRHERLDRRNIAEHVVGLCFKSKVHCSDDECVADEIVPFRDLTEDEKRKYCKDHECDYFLQDL